MAFAEYTLMNKNRPVVTAVYDQAEHRFARIVDVHDVGYAPPSTIEHDGTITTDALNRWWAWRAIPPSRNRITSLLDQLHVYSALSLAEKSFGLSLSDCYWVNDAAHPLRWADINYFDNDFSGDLGMLTLGQTSAGKPDLRNPSGNVNGNLQKKWIIEDGVRCLIKESGGYFGQEAFNEVVATALHRRLLEQGDFVPYSLRYEDDEVYSSCPNMLSEDEELVCALDLLASRKKPNHLDDYRFLLNVYDEIGVPDAEEGLAKMIACDFILANTDRHRQNFGVIRDVETLEYKRIAPIYDSGMCLWSRKRLIAKPKDFSYEAKPFEGKLEDPEEQVRLLKKLDWFDPSKLDGFAEEAMAVLSENVLMPSGRLAIVGAAIEAKCDALKRYFSSPTTWRGWLPPIPSEVIEKRYAPASQTADDLSESKDPKAALKNAGIIASATKMVPNATKESPYKHVD